MRLHSIASDRSCLLTGGLLLAGVVLAGCTSSGGGAGKTGGTNPDLQYTTEDFKQSAYCPPVQIRAGTGAMTVYERGHEADQTFARYQASINRTARQCSVANGTLTVKVGIGGRVVAGPKGGAGNINLPIRIAVVKQVGGSSGPVFSELFKVPVSLAAPTFGADFNQVVEQVTFPVDPSDRNLIVYVGFDEGTKAQNTAALD
jgi:hypothetical protein